MTNITQLKPTPAYRVKTNQCCRTVHISACDGYLKHRRTQMVKKGFDPTRCSHEASFIINGEALCTKHAGATALKILLAEKAP